MKRTEKKLKSKGIKTYMPKARYCLCFKYNRAFVANHLGDAPFVPFSRTSMEGDWWEWDDHDNHFLLHYLKRFFRKQVGKNVNEVFHRFSKLGWKHSHEMYYYWEKYVNPRLSRFRYSIDDNDCLVSPTQQNYSSSPYQIDMEKEKDKPKAKHPRASKKQLTRKHLEHNESIITTTIADKGYGSVPPGLLGTMYVEDKHNVIERNVYLVKVPHNPLIYTPVRIFGLYREERSYYHNAVTTRIETVFNKKEQILEAKIIQDKSDSCELVPCIKTY